MARRKHEQASAKLASGGIKQPHHRAETRRDSQRRNNQATASAKRNMAYQHGEAAAAANAAGALRNISGK